MHTKIVYVSRVSVHKNRKKRSNHIRVSLVNQNIYIYKEKQQKVSFAENTIVFKIKTGTKHFTTNLFLLVIIIIIIIIIITFIQSVIFIC